MLGDEVGPGILIPYASQGFNPGMMTDSRARRLRDLTFTSCHGDSPLQRFRMFTFYILVQNPRGSHYHTITTELDYLKCLRGGAGLACARARTYSMTSPRS